jgi:hypothetical protein
VLPMANVAAQSTVPVLHYAPPANAVRMGAGLSDDYSFRGFNASIQVYPFRPFAGNIQQAFQMTLLRDWIDPMHQEENLGVLPTFESLAIPGADFAIGAGFAENRAGLPFPQHYDAAERSDPRNSGRYVVDGGKLVLLMSAQQPIVTDAPSQGVLRIYGVQYTRH